MEDRDYVSYRVAELLHEKKFNDECERAYRLEKVDSLYVIGADGYRSHTSCNSELESKGLAAPSLWHAQQWLRNCGLSVEAGITSDGWKWYVWDCTARNKGEFLAAYLIDRRRGSKYESYESALDAGIERALKFL